MPDPQSLSGFPPLVPTDTSTIVPGNLDVTQSPSDPANTPTPPPPAPRPIETPPAPSGFPQAPPDRLTDAMNRAPGVKPDQAAKIFALQVKTGLPYDVIARNLDQVSTAASAQGFDAAKFRAESPALASWLEQHPLNAALAQDDLGALGKVESTVRFAGAAARRLAGSIYGGANLGVWSVLQSAGDALKLPGLTAWAKAWNEFGQYSAQTIAGPTAYDPAQAYTGVAGGILEGIGAAGGMLPATAAGVMGGGEAAVLGILGARHGAESYLKARESGLNIAPSLAYGALQAGTMTLAAKVPTELLLGDLAASAGLTKTLVHQVLANVPAMQVQTAVEDFNEWAYIHPNRPFEEYLAARPGAAMDSLISTIAMVATQTGGAHAINKLVGGLAGRAAVERLAKDGAESSVAKIAPAKFDEFVQHAAANGQEAFYAPVDTFSEYWQSKGVDPATKAADLTGDPDALAKATQSGEDLRIPAGKLAAALADDPAHHKYFADELRVAPDMMNGREADAFEQAEAARSTVAPTSDTTAIDEVNKQVTERLTAAGYSPEDAKTNADVLARLIGVPALRAGLGPLAVYEKYGLTVTRDALTTAPGATLPGSGQTSAGPVAGRLDLADRPVESQSPPAIGNDVRGSGEAGAQYGGVDQVPGDLREHFDAALSDARAGGFTGSDDSLAAAYNAQVEKAQGIADQAAVGAEEDDRSWRGLLQAVADAGGVGVEANTGNDADVGGRVLQGGSKGEVEALLDQFERSFAKGRKLRAGGRGNAVQRLVGDVAGIRGIVKRKGGATLDAILESLHEGGQFQHLASTNDLLDALKRGIHDAHDFTAKRVTPAHALTNILESLLGVNPTTNWWEPAGEANLLDPESAEEQPLGGSVPTSWDVYLRQDLFDMMGPDPAVPVETLAEGPDEAELQRRSMERMLESVAKAAGRMDLPPDVQEKISKILGAAPPPAKVDTLSTGEQQPRLPGDVGDVRDVEIEQPKLGEVRDDFELTAPEETQASQASLFQSVFHGSPHKFEEFSLHAIGSGEGNQSYGWGLYFASRREVAEQYRKRLTEAADLEVQTADGRTFHLPNWVVGELKRNNSGEVIADFEQRIADNKAKLADPAERQGHMVEAALKNQERILEGVRAFAEGGGTVSEPGRLFHVELPDDAHYLDWDKPASEQSPEVQAALKALGVEWTPFKPMSLKQWDRWVEGPTFARLWREDIGIREALAEGQRLAQSSTAGFGATTEETAAFDRWQSQHQGLFNKGVVDPTGDQIYGELQRANTGVAYYGGPNGRTPIYKAGAADAAKLASEALAAQGIGGIRYLDGFSRREGAGSSNFVVFDPKLITVKQYEQAAQPDLTQDTLNAWTKQVQQDAGADLLHFDVYLTKQGELQLGTLAVARGAQRAGIGSAVMERLTRFADAQGRRITLYLADKGYLAKETGGPTSRARLMRFYKRFGFVENAGRNKDFGVSASMYRDPSTTAAGLVSQPEASTPTTHGTPEFQRWFRASQVTDAEGAPLVVYHGANRGERVGSSFQKNRATSGPMAFFTDDRAIAEKYATGKQDTSYEEPADYNEWFKFKPAGSRQEVDVDSAWRYLTPAEQRTVIERLPTVGYQNHEEASGPIVADSQSIGSQEHIDHELARANGNGLKAAKEMWLSSGALFGDEQRFSEVLDGLGLAGRFRYADPQATTPKVFDVYLSIQRPLVTNAIKPEVIDALEKAASRQRARPEQYGADFWDKATRDPREWAKQLAADLAEGGNSMVWTSIPDWVTKTLKTFGFDGIHDTGGKMGGAGHDVWIPFEPTQIKSASENSGAYDVTKKSIYRQGEKAGPRGVLRFGPDHQMNIALFEGANPTTFIHEAGHLGLEVFNDIVDGVEAIDQAARTPQQQQLVEDRAELFKQLGVENREALRADDSKHEAFTELLSRYLLKGEAPSISLRRTFARIRSWLLAFYTSLKPHVQNLTPEVRGIFDRMLATEREILDAEAEGSIAPMFLTPETAGMAPEKFALYADKVADASRQSREQLQTRLLGELEREQTREWEARKAEVRGQVERETYDRPVYQALAAMQRGTKPDGTPLIDGAEHATPAKLSRQAIVDQFGKDRLKRLPKPYIYTREGGMSPDAVADLFGFTSGDELLTAVEQAAPMKEVIAHETERRMLVEHGSLMLDGALHERARAAVVNDYRDQVLRDELRALAELKRTVAPFEKAEAKRGAAQSAYQARWQEAEARLRVAVAEGHKQVEIDQLTDEVQNLRRQARGGAATIRAALIPDQVLKQIVADRVASMPIAQLKPETFWSAARRNGTKAIEFAARQDFNNAIAAKQQQQIAEKMYRAVADAKDDVETRVRQTRQLATPAAQRRIGRAGHGILEQLNDVLGRYNFAPEARSGKPMREWVEGLQGESIPGLDVLPDEVLNDVARPYGTLTYEELQGVTDGIAQLAHLATVVNQLLSAQAAKDFADERDGLVSSIYAKLTKRKTVIRITPADEKWRLAADIFASHAKLSTLTLLLDAGEDGGPMWEAITRRANEANDAAVARKIEAGTAYHALLAKYYSKRELARFTEDTYIPEIQASLSKEERLEVLKNYGNKTSRDRLLSDPVRKWNAAQVEAIIGTLDYRDTQYVQAHWDYLNTFWPEIAAKAKRLTGLEPQKVEALPVKTAWGELRGGYHPLVYDARLDVRAGQAQEVGEAKLIVAGAYMMATTRRGHEKARVAHLARPIRLEMATTFAHIDQVIHDLTHHEMLIDATRLLRDRALAKAIQETKGDIVYQKLTRVLRDIALGDRAPGGGPSIAEKGATFLRTRTQIAGLAYNLWTGLQQPLGLFNGMERVGAKWVAKGMTRWLRDAATMQNTAHWIADQSPMMRERLGGRGLTQDLHDVRASMSRDGGWFDKAVRKISGDRVTQQGILDSYLWHIGLAQSVADVPTWLGAYEKEMAGNPSDEKRAVALADQAVLDSQGGSHIKDLAEVQRGGPLLKLWMTFASYSVMILNATARAAIQTDFRSPADMLRFASRMSLLYVVPNLLTEILRCGVGRANCDDAEAFIRRVGGQALNTGLNGVLGVRELSAAANIVVGADTGAHGYEGTAGTRLFETMTNAAIQWHQGKWDEGAEKAFFAASGLIFNYPAAQIQRSIDGFVALEEGRTHNPLALLVGPPPKEKAQ